MRRYPEPTVGALIVGKDGRILLVKSHKWMGKYSVPGGHIELGETMEKAVVREVREETGLDVEVVRLLLVQEAIFPSEFHDADNHFIFFDYLCRAQSEKPVLDQKEIQEYVWLDPKKAIEMDLESYTRRLVLKFLEDEDQG